MVVSGSDLHSRQISNLLGLVVGEVARGYCCVSVPDVEPAAQIQPNWMHLVSSACFRVDFSWASFLSVSVHTLLMASLT